MHLASVDLDTSMQLRSMLVVWLTFSFRLHLVEAQKPALNMLFMMPAKTTEAIVNSTAPAIVIALNSIDKNGIMDEFYHEWLLLDGGCSSLATARAFYATWMDTTKQINVIIGGYCEKVCDFLVTLSKSLNVPFLAVRCKLTEKRNHELIPTFLSMAPWPPSVIPSFIQMVEVYKWTRVAIVMTSDEASTQMAILLKHEMEARNWTAILILTTLDMISDGLLSVEAKDEIEVVLEQIKRQARVIFFTIFEAIYVGRILFDAKKNGMYNGEFAFIGFVFSYFHPSEIGATIDEMIKMRVGLLYFEALDSYQDLEHGRFIELMNNKTIRNHEKLSWIVHQDLGKTDRLSIRSAGDLYAAVHLYFMLLNNTIATMNTSSKNDPNIMNSVAANGTLVMSRIGDLFSGASRSTHLNDALGNQLFDSAGVREPAWSLTNMKEGNKETTVYKYIRIGAEISTSREDSDITLTWPGNTTKVPSAVPKCGLDNEKCLSELELILIGVCSVLGVLFIGGVIFAFFNARRVKREVERKTLSEWQVKWSEVTVIGDNVTGRLSTHDALRSKTSFEVGSQADHSDVRSSQRSTGSHFRLYTFVGTFKGKTVAIKKINRKSVNIYHPSIYVEIKQLFHINHENVNPFLGVCGEAPNVCVLMLYADRGSLQDVLVENKYDINWEFRLCLATDIAKGMEYLHESPVGPHGHLTSSNCVVDRKWACRITDYGLKQFKQSYNPDISTYKWNTDLLWTAPEILDKPEADQIRVYGTKEGDVYSFGIIVSELITKEMPYHSQLESISPEDVVAKLKTDPHYRPVLPPPEGSVGAGWNSLAVLCWHRKPEVRPNFKSIRAKLRSIHGGKIPNLMQRMQHMLKDALERKATDIATEKKRTETVIYSLLPKSVADKVVAGKEVRPQRIESVTLCFCETTDLYASTKSLSPTQMAELLKSLFHIYDGVINKYNVIEVNCVGCKDSMMLGSGLPLSTEKHAEDICELSLDLISEALSFKTPLTSALNLSLKISIHSGPILTAVIWRMFPRYCVNGDAVQTIMAMHSASKAMRVRISQATYDRIRQSGGFTAEEGGKVTLKDATTMRSYWLTGKSGYRKPLPQSIKRRSSSLRSEQQD